MARGLWKGAISFGLVNVPVELFSAEKTSAEIDHTMLDKRDLGPVGYKRYNKSTGEDVHDRYNVEALLRRSVENTQAKPRRKAAAQERK